MPHLFELPFVSRIHAKTRESERKRNGFVSIRADSWLRAHHRFSLLESGRLMILG